MKQQKFSTANEKQYTVLGYVITSTSDLQPSTAIANQSPGKSASANLKHNNMTIGPACTFKAHYMTYKLHDQLDSWFNPLMAKYSDGHYSGTENHFNESTTPYNP